MAKLEYEIKLQHETQDKGGEYVNEEARNMGERIVSSLLLTKIILFLTC